MDHGAWDNYSHDHAASDKIEALEKRIAQLERQAEAIRQVLESRSDILWAEDIWS